MLIGDLDLTGLWTRELLVRPGEAPDTTTAVHWLQGAAYYIDLRQPVGRPDFTGVSGPGDLTADHLDWMACQEGFAGTLTFEDGDYTWNRDLDIQPPGPLPDCGRLWVEDGLLKEEGRAAPYLEHWRRGPAATVPVAEARLKQGAVDAILVRVGPLFMFARSRPSPLPPGGDLRACIASASLREAQDMVDCEISFGQITRGRWLVEHSSLPFREGRPLEIGTDWIIVDLHGFPADLGL